MGAFEDRWKSLEVRRKKLVDRVMALDPEAQALSKNKGFTPAETLDHMAASEAWYIDRLTPEQQSRKAKPNFLFRWLVAQMRKTRQLPAPGAMRPRQGVDAAAGADRWAKVREELGAALRASSYDDAIIRHPIFGRMSPKDILDLLEAHHDYHESRL